MRPHLDCEKNETLGNLGLCNKLIGLFWKMTTRHLWALTCPIGANQRGQTLWPDFKLSPAHRWDPNSFGMSIFFNLHSYRVFSVTPVWSWVFYLHCAVNKFVWHVLSYCEHPQWISILDIFIRKLISRFACGLRCLKS